jgi:hypothetical protein
MSDTCSKVEVITGVARRRRFSTDLKLAVVAEACSPACRWPCCLPPKAVTQPGIPLGAVDERRRQGGGPCR